MSFGITQEFGHPIAIKDEGLTLTPSASSIDFVGAGVTGSVLGSAVTETISGAAAVFTPVRNEVPSGTVDGSNVTFTLAHTPLYGIILVLNLGTLTPNVDYTLSGATITFIIPPAPSSIISCSYEY